MVKKEYWTWLGYISKEMNSAGCSHNGWHYFMIPVKLWLRHPIRSYKLFLNQKPVIKNMTYNYNRKTDQ